MEKDNERFALTINRLLDILGTPSGEKQYGKHILCR